MRSNVYWMNLVIDIGNTSTTFSGTTIVKATDTNVEFDNNLNIIFN